LTLTLPRNAKGFAAIDHIKKRAAARLSIPYRPYLGIAGNSWEFAGTRLGIAEGSLGSQGSLCVNEPDVAAPPNIFGIMPSAVHI
jgi:hypothetical protein